MARQDGILRQGLINGVIERARWQGKQRRQPDDGRGDPQLGPEFEPDERGRLPSRHARALSPVPTAEWRSWTPLRPGLMLAVHRPWRHGDGDDGEWLTRIVGAELEGGPEVNSHAHARPQFHRGPIAAFLLAPHHSAPADDVPDLLDSGVGDGLRDFARCKLEVGEAARPAIRQSGRTTDPSGATTSGADVSDLVSGASCMWPDV
jgi:hypothetical protein